MSKTLFIGLTGGGILLGILSFFIMNNHEAEAPKLTQEESKLELSKTEILYTMPEESDLHEATWLQWPHQHQYGVEYRDSLDQTWVAMTKALQKSEKVHIVAYDNNEKERIENLLVKQEIPRENLVWYVYPNDDVWVRDNGPIYVRDKSGKLLIEDWGFNGWGKKEKYTLSDIIPERIAESQDIERVNLNGTMINEGGAVELDGNGTLMATRSATLNENRNPGMTKAQAESLFKKYLGAENFIWLDGKAGLEITDMHIDGFARFGNQATIVTMSAEDLLEWEVPESDISALLAAKDKLGNPYTFIQLPLTKKDVVTEDGKDLGYKGSYVNYYIANTVVLVPNYQDEQDAVANSIIQKLYPSKEIIGIDVRNLYENGGMVHCVTQQQPKNKEKAPGSP